MATTRQLSKPCHSISSTASKHKKKKKKKKVGGSLALIQISINRCTDRHLALVLDLWRQLSQATAISQITPRIHRDLKGILFPAKNIIAMLAIPGSVPASVYHHN